MVTAKLTKVLHRYGDLQISETMRFATLASAESFRKDMLNKRVKGLSGTSYTITSFSL
jgi:hypothetical protein